MTDFTAFSDLGSSDIAHQQDILISQKGVFKFAPQVGVGIINYLHDEDFTPALIEAKKQLSADGMRIKNIFINPKQQLVIDGYYENR